VKTEPIQNLDFFVHVSKFNFKFNYNKIQGQLWSNPLHAVSSFSKITGQLQQKPN